MKSRARIGLAILVLLAGWYAVRAVEGWIGGISWSAGRRLAARGDLAPSLARLERAAVGHNRSEVLWLRGQVRLGLWQNGLAAGQPVAELWPLLLDAYSDYTAAIATSPAQGWFWVSLGDLYHQMERSHRFSHGLPLELLGENRWPLVGRDGRIAVGMIRMGIAREPASPQFWDRLAFVLWDYGLPEPALEAVRRSAAALPIYRLHEYDDVAVLPPRMIDAFAEGSRASLDSTPFLRRTLHLLALARIELRRGNAVRAEQDLRESLALPGEELNRAEAWYWLGDSLLRQGRYEEADEQLLLSADHPAFATASLALRARIAELTGRVEDALDLLMRARREDPHRLPLSLDYARIASELGEWDRAEESLKWAALVHPAELVPRLRLAELYVTRGQRGDARATLADLQRLAPDDPRVAQIEALLVQD